MRIFSFLGKKDRQADVPEPDKDSSRQKRESDPARGPRAGFGNSQQRIAAAETARKIDEIESEMTSELGRTGKKSSKPAPAPAPMATTAVAEAANSAPGSQPAEDSESLGNSTGFGFDPRSASVEISSSETHPAIEESAILFANEQYDMVEQMLTGAIHDASLGDKSKIVWNMLFDLYQVTGKKEPFENLSIDFAAKFETSPPGWDDGQPDMGGSIQPASVTPAITFSGKLDESISKQIERAYKLSEKNGPLRLEFTRVAEVQADGCELLLSALRKLQKSGNELILVGAPELATKIRATIETGRRDETDTPWLLLLEILQLLNREQEFEETSIDYCITFEVSPPAFVAPKKVSTMLEVEKNQEQPGDKFSMPPVVDGRSNALAQIGEYITQHNPAVLDCKHLKRVDFSAAGQLLSMLAPLTAQGKKVQLVNVNYLVLALFHVIGLRDVVQITPHKR